MEPKIAIVHDYLTEYGGAEKVVESIHEVFPTATIFTSSFKPEVFPNFYQNFDIRTLNTERLPLHHKLAKHYTFLYPSLFESIDLSEFDIIISSSSAWAKSVITKAHQLHICYIHTPPRFLYHYPGESNKRGIWYYKPLLAYVDHFLRFWDFAGAQRPNYFVANSHAVAERVNKFYRRKADVIYPPVRIDREIIVTEGAHRFDDNYYMSVGRLVKFKNFHLLIEAFNHLDFPLRVAGTGTEESFLRKLIRRDIALLGRVSEKDLNLMLQRSKGFIFPVKDEDFGIAAVEAMAYGKPVLAHKSGGPMEIIEEGKTGMFFEDLSVEGIMKAVVEFENAINSGIFDPKYIKDSVKKFSEDRFKKEFKDYVLSKYSELTS